MKKTILWSFLFCMIQTATAFQSHAEWNYTFIPTASLGLEYDNNVYWSQSNEQSDFNYQGTITLPVHATSPATDLNLSYRTTRFEYFSLPENNYGNHYITLNASHNLTQRLRLSLSDSFASMKDSDRLLRSEDSNIASDIIVEKVRNDSNSLTGSMEYSLSPKASISLSATDSLSRYSIPTLYDSSGKQGAFTFNYILDPLNTIFTSISANTSNYERSDLELKQNALYSPLGYNPFSGSLSFGLFFNSEFDRSENKSAYIGWTHHFSSTLNASLYIGTRKTEDITKNLSLVAGGGVEVPHDLPDGSLVYYTIDSIPQPFPAVALTGKLINIPGAAIKPVSEDSQKSSGLIYNLTVDKTFQGSDLSLSFDQSTNQRAAYGGTSVIRSYGAKYNHRLSARLSAFLNGRYSQNKNESDSLQDNYHTLRIGTGFSYSMTRNLSSSLSWNHTVQKRDLQGAVTPPRTERDVVALLFTYKWPLER
ncbi:MAG: hypothetical protein AABY87_09930 [bacterium]